MSLDGIGRAEGQGRRGDLLTKLACQGQCMT